MDGQETVLHSAGVAVQGRGEGRGVWRRVCVSANDMQSGEGNEDGYGETGERADEDVLGGFDFLRLAKLAEAENGLCGEEEADELGIMGQDESQDEEPLKEADPLTRLRETHVDAARGRPSANEKGEEDGRGLKNEREGYGDDPEIGIGESGQEGILKRRPIGIEEEEPKEDDDGEMGKLVDEEREGARLRELDL